MSYAIHNQNLAFNDSAIAQYMNTDFIVIDISLCVALAREQFFEKLKDDDIPSHIFIEDNGRLAGLIAVRKLLQATDTVQPVKGLMISDFIQLKPEDERADVAGLLAHAGADVVPVVTHGKLVGCLTEREIAHLLEDDVTEDAQLQGATLPLEKPYLETSAFSLWKKRSVWLLLLFVALAHAIGWPADRGMLTIWLAHVTFCTAYVAVVISSRLRELDRSIEEAAMDLGATPLKVFFIITLPMIMPAVISGWLLAFTLSLDDLVIASFVSGPGATTLPMLVFSSVRMGVNPEINALASIILGVVGIVGFIAWYLMARAEKQRVRDIQRARRG